jgi:hypothetical protein
MQAMTMGIMRDDFHRETLDGGLTIEYLNTYIETNKSLGSTIEKTLLMRRNGSNGILVTIVFLDKSNKPVLLSGNTPMGVEIKTPSIDAGIANIFGNKNSVIL